jgi:phosphoribosylglycinamide formyltransferase-1
MSKNKNIAVLASGNGTNFEAIVSAIDKGKIKKAKVTVLITDNKYAFVRTRARKHRVREIFVDPKKYSSRNRFDRELIKIIRNARADFVVLAGYMRVLSPFFVRAYKHKIVNIHPALLPSFKGIHAIERAHAYGVTVTGVTIHFVDEKVDHGPIIIQGAVKIKENEPLEKLERRIHRLEHTLYPRAIKILVEGRIKVRRRHVEIV